ncbi:hypothetical protein [Citrobacter sp. RHB25-C09]|uniref:hypothetical protein n=1 Tax=Citrobacter sp. RHB25-C09 TaxID=2742624 RepID=UPI0015EF4FB0|nr:hypothetical protein [Citrobacter sp. RHB25-C09]QMI06456.1 hypothetical protein HVY19_17025 [Citrobacter sp. RHB25-C09]
MKIKKLIAVALMTLALLTGLLWGYYLKQNSRIDCQGRVVWDINDEKFQGDVAYQLHHGQGVATITGELKKTREEKYKISRIVYFNYQNVRNNYIISSTDLVRFPTDDLSDTGKQWAMPNLYLTEGASFSLKITSWQEGWAFTTIGGPSLLCRRVE